MANPRAQIDLIAGKASRFKSTMRSVTKLLGSVRARMQAVARAAKIMLIGSAAALAGMVVLAAKQEEAERSLAAALSLTGKNSKAAMKDLKEYASSLQEVTIHGDETILTLMAMGASMAKLSGTELKDATKAAIGLASAYGLDLTAAMRLVARARVGDTASLKRYGIVVDTSLSALEQFNEVVKIGVGNFSLAEEAAKTTTGQLKQFKNQMGDLGEVIGAVVIPSLLTFVNWIRTLLPEMDAAKTKGQEWTESISRGWQRAKDIFMSFADSFLMGLAVIRAALENWKGVVEGVAIGALLAFGGMFLDIKHWLTEKLPAYLAWFAKHWLTMFTDVGGNIRKLFENMWTNVASFFGNVWKWLKGDETNWEWTGLADGFTKTVRDELPKIADRELTGMEKKLRARMKGLKTDLMSDAKVIYEDMSSWLKGKMAEDEKELGKPGPVTPDGPGAAAVVAAAAAKKKGGGPSAFETMAAAIGRISSAAARRDDKAEQAAMKTASNTGKVVEKVTELIDLTKAGQHIGGPLVATFGA